jgi:flagellar biosynthesis protein FlhG
MLRNQMEDQAAGLRRLLGKSVGRKFVVLSSTSPAQKNIFLLNLASAMIHCGNSAHLLDTRMDDTGIGARSQTMNKLDLWDLALKSQPLQKGFYEFMLGGRISKLSTKPTANLLNKDQNFLTDVIERLSSESNIWLLDSELKLDNPFLIPEFTDSQILLLVSNQADSIKKGYTYLKQISQTMGRRQVFLILLNMDASQAQLIYRNMSSTANQFLAISLLQLGIVPADEHIGMAAQLGKALHEVFPHSKAAQSVKEIANHLLENQTTHVTPIPSQNSNHLVLEH